VLIQQPASLMMTQQTAPPFRQNRFPERASQMISLLDDVFLECLVCSLLVMAPAAEPGL